MISEISSYLYPTQHLSWSSTKRRQKRASLLQRRRKTHKNPASSGKLVVLYYCAKKSKNYVELFNRYSEYGSLSSADEVAKYLWLQQTDSKTENQRLDGLDTTRKIIKSLLIIARKDSTRKHCLKNLEIMKLFRRWLKQRAKCNNQFLNKSWILKECHVDFIGVAQMIQLVN